MKLTLPGTRRIEVLDQGPPLGTGVYGVVYAAKDEEGNAYAVKKVDIGTTLSYQLFVQETRLLRKTKESQSQYVCTFIHSCTVRPNGLLIFVRALGTVQELLPRLQQAPAAAQMLRSIAALHQLHITHRDIKMDNFLVYENRIVVCDLGLASDEKRMMTLDVQALQYRPPELFLMQQPYDWRIDCWSLGMLFAHMLHGKIPYDGTEKDILHSIFGHRGVKVPRDASQLSLYARAPISNANCMQSWIDELLQLNPAYRASPASLCEREDTLLHLRATLFAAPSETENPPSGRIDCDGRSEIEDELHFQPKGESIREAQSATNQNKGQQQHLKATSRTNLSKRGEDAVSKKRKRSEKRGARAEIHAS